MGSNTQILLVLLSRPFLSQSSSSHCRNHCPCHLLVPAKPHLLSPQLLFLPYKPATRGFHLNHNLHLGIFCVTALAVASQVMLYRLHLVSVTKQHIGILREFYQDYSPDVYLHQASWIGTIPMDAQCRISLYVAQEQEWIRFTTFPLYSPNKARFLQSSFADCCRSTAAA